MTTDIVAIDPGVTNGLATVSGQVYKSFQMAPTDFPHPHESLYDLLSNLQPKVIVYERFDFRAAKNGVVLTGVEYIGVIELYAQVKCLDIVKNSTSDMTFWSDDKLRRLSLYNVGRKHANDAMRHLLAYQMRSDPLWKDTIIAQLKKT